MKKLHCANCGLELKHKRLATKGVIYDVVEPHICQDEVPDPEVNPGPALADGKFVQKINKLRKVHTDNVGDRRPTTQIKDPAPKGVLNQLERLRNV
jgi:hypothetical protein